MTVMIQPRMSLGLPYLANFKDQVVRRRYIDAMKTFLMHVTGGANRRPSHPNYEALAVAVVNFEEKICSVLPKKAMLRPTDGNMTQIGIATGMQQLYGLPLPQIIRSHVEANSTANVSAEVLLPEHAENLGRLIVETPIHIRLAYLQWETWLQTEPLWDVPWKAGWLQNLKDLTGRACIAAMFPICRRILTLHLI